MNQLLPIAIAVTMALQGYPNINEAPAIVSGVVLYKDGAPVRDAMVEVHFYGPTSGLRPSPQRTNDKGYFEVVTQAYGEGVVSASKESEGYPNAAIAFYKKEALKSVKQVNLLPSTWLSGLKLFFDDPSATVEFEMVSSDHQAAVENARILICLAGQPSIYGSYTVAPNGVFPFVLPAEPIEVRVTAPGFADWSYVNPQGERSLIVKAGGHKVVRVVLRRL